jgi:glycosyltransferase involved in cell wall biosynthesis
MTPTYRAPLRIAQVAPLYESVPPRFYGGTERVVSYLTEELVRQGHEVTLFASGDSRTSADLVAICPRAVRLDPYTCDATALHTVMLERVFREVDAFDVIHFHTDGMHLALARRHEAPALTTLHGRLDLGGLQELYDEFAELPLVSISHSQRQPLARAHWVATVYHGLPMMLHRPTFAPGRYLAFLGRISPEKRVDRAIAIAHRLQIPLKIAAKVDRVDREYFEAKIAPLLASSLVEWIGEIGEAEKTEFLGNALALLFPIDWPEPFGLAMIEAMACGTPVIAYRRGSVPEVIDEGITGYVVENLDAAVAAVERVHNLDRRRCRAAFEQRFSAERMAQDYCRLYTSMVRVRDRRWQLRA